MLQPQAFSVRSGVPFGNAFVLERMLGRGGMGQVWQASHLETGADVALKFMNEDAFVFLDSRGLFAREMRATTAVRSPNVVECIAAVDDVESPYMVLERLGGENLATYLNRTGPLPFPLARQVLGQLCESVRATHAAGVVHCDVKCNNIILSFERERGPVVKLIDFGLARRRNEAALTSDARPSGTVYAMSPERMLTPTNVDEADDYWGVAVVAYQLITGALPFAGHSMAAVLCAIATRKLLDASCLRNGATPQIDAFFAKAFHRRREERFSTLDEMATTMDCLLADAARAALPGTLERSLPVEVPRFACTSAGAPTVRFASAVNMCALRRLCA